MFKHPEQRVGVFIDTQNMYYSARYLFQRKVNFKNIVENGVAGRKLIRALAYVVRTKGAEETPFFEALQKSGIETREKDLIEYASGHKKGDWDVGLAVDIVQMLDILDVVIIVSGDGDFLPLVEYIQSRGRIAEVMAFSETTSSNLIDFVDDYTDLSANQRLFLICPTEKRGQKEKADKDFDENKETEASGFFMQVDEPDEEKGEESRKRRLEF